MASPLVKEILLFWSNLSVMGHLFTVVIASVCILAIYSLLKSTISDMLSTLKLFIKKLSPFFKKLKHVKIEGGSISLDSAGDKNESGYYSHRDCPRYADILHMIQAQKELYREEHKIQRKIDRIYDYCILKEQMHQAEYRIEEIINLAETIFSQVLKSNNVGSDIFASKEYREYKGFLELIREKIIIKIRLMCRDNHFAEKTEAEFSAYIKMQNNLIQSFVKEKVRFYFFYGAELKDYDQMMKIYDTIEDTIESFLYTAREITKAKITEAEELEEQIETLEIEFDKKFGIIGG